MSELHVSEWTPAAYWAREERRRRAIQEGEPQKDFQGILQSEWTLPAFGARELERRRREFSNSPVSSLSQRASEPAVQAGATQFAASEGAQGCAPLVKPPPQPVRVLATPNAEGAAAAPGSDWTLPAFQSREIERVRQERLEAATANPQPVVAQPVLFSDWTLPAFQAREARRLTRETRKAANTSNILAQSSPVVLSDWTLPAFQEREIERVRQERLEAAAANARPGPASARPLPTTSRGSALRSQPVLLSDWTLPAFQAREMERTRQDARGATARTPLPGAAMRPLLRATLTPMAPAPARVPVSQPPRPAVRPREPATVQPKINIKSHSQSVHPDQLADVGGGANSSPKPRQAPSAAVPPALPTMKAPELNPNVAPSRSSRVDSERFLDGHSAMLRRLGFVLGAGALIGLGVFLIRVPFQGKGPIAHTAKKSEPTQRAQNAQAPAQKSVTPPVEPTAATRLPDAAAPSPTASRPVRPAVNTPHPTKATPPLAASSATEQPADQRPAGTLQPIPAPMPAAAPNVTQSEPATTSQPAKAKGAQPHAQHAAVPRKPSKPKHIEPKSEVAKPPEPEPSVEQRQPESWSEPLTNSE